jgi:hypothetical protein
MTMDFLFLNFHQDSTKCSKCGRVNLAVVIRLVIERLLYIVESHNVGYNLLYEA